MEFFVNLLIMNLTLLVICGVIDWETEESKDFEYEGLGNQWIRGYQVSKIGK